jgi:short-subunit dehydrogenase
MRPNRWHAVQDGVVEAALLVARVCSDVMYLTLLALVALPLRVVRAVAGGTRGPPACAPADGVYDSVLITGASCGIGAGLARQFARPGARLVLTAVHRPSLDAIVRECEALGATVVPRYVDVRDAGSMAALVLEADAARALQLVVANAGIVPSGDGLKDTPLVLETNLLGCANTVLPAVECFRKHGRGQLVLLSSLGGYAPATCFFMLGYVASKTAIRSFGEGLRGCLRDENIGVTVVTPGFVESRMTALQNKLGVNFIAMWSNKDACDAIRRGIELDKPLVAFPSLMYIGVRLSGDLPLYLRELLGSALGRFDPFRKMDQVTKEQPNYAKLHPVGLNEDTINPIKDVLGSVPPAAGLLSAMALLALLAICLPAL